MRNNWLNKNSKTLFKALSQIDNENDMANFCRDLMTEAEIEAFSGRWQVAQLLASGLSQREIAKKTGVSIATVTRVNQWLTNGMNGYKKVIENTLSANHHHKTKPIVL